MIMIRPSVMKKASKLTREMKASSFSDLIEKLILEGCNERGL